MLVAIGGPVADHLSAGCLEGGVQFLHRVAEVLPIADRVSQPKDRNRLPLQIQPCSTESHRSTCQDAHQQQQLPTSSIFG